MQWTSDRIGKLRKMWDEGMTSRGIAERLTDIQDPVSRDDVILKLISLGLYTRSDPMSDPMKHQLQARFYDLITQVNEVMSEEPRLRVLLSRDGFLVAAATNEEDGRKRFR